MALLTILPAPTNENHPLDRIKTHELPHTSHAGHYSTIIELDNVAQRPSSR
ncbi:hypothetical protein Pst134EA_016003 [Puccinia striiformis f. sp. tritici]|uniref:hypothetical protein n=1 Tax=Puccinia striiformis f. sp. tritici TaxID=168172 RepID=UPI002007C9DE|nr:hypothetical protein Pst134EA_016003 [Puccinia striiformis f. sp. tritici]KAH9463922.1 hypothetical protein Pst134EA_016003 [Puccinia striiformis f. sp. tritici]